MNTSEAWIIGLLLTFIKKWFTHYFCFVIIAASCVWLEGFWRSQSSRQQESCSGVLHNLVLSRQTSSSEIIGSVIESRGAAPSGSRFSIKQVDRWKADWHLIVFQCVLRTSFKLVIISKGAIEQDQILPNKVEWNKLTFKGTAPKNKNRYPLRFCCFISFTLYIIWQI